MHSARIKTTVCLVSHPVFFSPFILDQQMNTLFAADKSKSL
jgi:hypothetical protein